MAKKFPLHPAHPERTCWGCDQYCAATDLRCGNGSDRTQHPMELFGDDWADWAPPVEGAQDGRVDGTAPADADTAADAGLALRP